MELGWDATSIPRRFILRDTHYLLIAAKLLPFVTFKNPNSSNPFSGRWRHGMSVRRPRPVEVPRTEGHLEITLVDSWGVTVFTGLFDYVLSPETMSLAPHPVPRN